MKQKKQKNLASSDKTTVVMFVIQLFLLFDKTESGEPGELGEPSESGEPGDSSDSMFQNSCESQLFDTDRGSFLR